MRITHSRSRPAPTGMVIANNHVPGVRSSPLLARALKVVHVTPENRVDERMPLVPVRDRMRVHPQLLAHVVVNPRIMPFVETEDLVRSIQASERLHEQGIVGMVHAVTNERALAGITPSVTMRPGLMQTSSTTRSAARTSTNKRTASIRTNGSLNCGQRPIVSTEPAPASKLL